MGIILACDFGADNSAVDPFCYAITSNNDYALAAAIRVNTKITDNILYGKFLFVCW